MLDTVLFYFFAGLAVVSAILVVTRRNAVHSAIFLDHSAARDRRNFSAVARGVSFYRAGDSVRRRDHGAVCFRDHARESRRGRAADALQPHVGGGLWLLALALGAQVYMVFRYARTGGASFFPMAPAAASQLEPNTELVGRRFFRITCCRLKSRRFCCSCP